MSMVGETVGQAAALMTQAANYIQEECDVGEWFITEALDILAKRRHDEDMAFVARLRISAERLRRLELVCGSLDQARAEV